MRSRACWALVALVTLSGCHTGRWLIGIDSPLEPPRLAIVASENRPLLIRRVEFRDSDSNVLWQIDATRGPVRAEVFSLTYGRPPPGFSQSLPLAGEPPRPLTAYPMTAMIMFLDPPEEPLRLCMTSRMGKIAMDSNADHYLQPYSRP